MTRPSGLAMYHHILLKISIRQDSLKARHMQHPPELGLPQDRKNDSDKEKEVTSEVSESWNCLRRYFW